MSTIDSSNSIQGLGIQSTRQASGSVLGKDDFLKLLVTQLNSQDPLNPMEGTEFSAQLAQFSSLEQMQNMNESLQQSLDANYLLTTSINNTMSATVIGKNVRAYGSQINLNEGETTSVQFELAGEAKTVEIEILDTDGKVRRTVELSDLKNGEHTFDWDGLDDAGVKLADGNYRFRINASDAEGSSISVKSFISGTITGVRFGQSGAVLMMGGMEIPMSDVYEILNG